MSVRPGHGGQSSQPAVLEKLRRPRAMRPALPISIDGGVKAHNAAEVVAAGRSGRHAVRAIDARPVGLRRVRIAGHLDVHAGRRRVGNLIRRDDEDALVVRQLVGTERTPGPRGCARRCRSTPPPTSPRSFDAATHRAAGEPSTRPRSRRTSRHSIPTCCSSPATRSTSRTAATASSAAPPTARSSTTFASGTCSAGRSAT